MYLLVTDHKRTTDRIVSYNFNLNLRVRLLCVLKHGALLFDFFSRPSKKNSFYASNEDVQKTAVTTVPGNNNKTKTISQVILKDVYKQ